MEQQQQPPAPDTQNKIVTTLKNLPTRPGVYIMKDATGKVIYVGKAINLRWRCCADSLTVCTVWKGRATRRSHGYYRFTTIRSAHA